MDIQNIMKVINAVTPCFQALLWPLVVVFILIYFRTPLKKFLGNMGEFTFKASTSGLEASAKQQETKIAAEAGAALGAASVSKSDDTLNIKRDLDDEKAREIANIVSQAVKPRIARQLADATVLWVDDNPDNNRYERIALEALGVSITTSTSTEEALEKIRLNKYDVIVSNMVRFPDMQAGYTLLENLQKRRIDLYFIIYGQSELPINRDEIHNKGAFGCTNNPQELLQLIMSAIEKAQQILRYTERASHTGKEAELAVLKWLVGLTLPGEGEIVINEGGDAPDFFIVEPDGTKTGVEVKYYTNPNILLDKEISKLTFLQNRSKHKIDKFEIFIVLPDEEKATIATDKFGLLPTSLPSNSVIRIGYLYGDVFMSISTRMFFDVPTRIMQK